MRREIGLYLVFGVLTTVIGVGGYALLLGWGWHYLPATTVSWMLAVLFAFLTNRAYVFQSTQRGVKQVAAEGGRFLISRLGTWAFETAGLALLIEGAAVEAMLSKYIMTVAVIVLNYIVSKLFVFKASS